MLGVPKPSRSGGGRTGTRVLFATKHHRARWDSLDEQRREIYIDRYTYLQEEYGEHDPNLAVIESAFYAGA